MTRRFIVQFKPDDEEHQYKAHILESPAGSGMTPFELSPEFYIYFEKLRLNFQSFTHGVFKGVPFRDPESKLVFTPQDMGISLYRGFFFNQELNELWNQSLGKSSKSMRLLIEFDPQDAGMESFLNIPWEVMTQSKNLIPLARKRNTSIARLINPFPLEEDKPKPFPPDGLRMLVVISEPKDRNPFNQHAFQKDLEEVLPPDLDLHFVSPATESEFKEALRNGPWHIVHMVGHGVLNNEKEKPYSGEWHFALDSEKDTSNYLTAEKLANMLHPYSQDIALVSVVSCESGEFGHWNGFNRFGGLAGSLLHADIDHAVCMQFPIGAEQARVFNRTFFKVLVQTRDLDAAMRAARYEIHLHWPRTFEWATPVLFTRSRIPFLFKPPEHHIVHLNTIYDGLDQAKWRRDREDVKFFDYALDFQDLRIINRDYWQRRIFKDFWRYKAGLPPETTHLEVEGDAKLSMYMALGFTFSAPSGIHLEVLQKNQSPKNKILSGHKYRSKLTPMERWTTKQQPAALDLDWRETSVQESGDQLLVSISLIRNVTQQAQRFAEQNKLNLRQTVSISYGAVENGTHALGFAQAVGRKLKKLTEDPHFKKIHLFFLGPKGLALFIGRELNAIKPIQLYEHVGEAYEPSILLVRPNG